MHSILKYYDPAMRQLIDNYVRAEDSEKLVDLADISFLDLIDTQGDKAIDSLPKKIKQNERSVAEILAANMRKMIISERPNIRPTLIKCLICLTTCFKNRKTVRSNTRN